MQTYLSRGILQSAILQTSVTVAPRRGWTRLLCGNADSLTRRWMGKRARMTWKTIYCARAFWLRSDGLHGGEVHRFLNGARAVEGARALFTGADGVAVFSMVGYPDEDHWEDPHLIQTFGIVPAMDAQGRDAPALKANAA